MCTECHICSEHVLDRTTDTGHPKKTTLLLVCKDVDVFHAPTPPFTVALPRVGVPFPFHPHLWHQKTTDTFVARRVDYLRHTPSQRVAGATWGNNTLAPHWRCVRAAAMERFSRFRDAGTGIQVFLPPVPVRSGCLFRRACWRWALGWALGWLA